MGVNFSGIHQEDFVRVMRVLQNQFDYLFIDTPAGVESGFRFASTVASRAIIVSNLDVSALQDADRVIGLLLKEGVAMLELVLNKVSPRAIDKGMCVKIEDATSWLAIPLLGYIVEDVRMQSCNNRRPADRRRPRFTALSLLRCACPPLSQREGRAAQAQ